MSTRVYGLPSGFSVKQWRLKILLFIVICVGAWLLYGYLSSSSYAQSSGVTFVNVTTQKGINISNFSWGLAWADFNNDGFPDLYSGNHSRGPALLKNNAGQSFTDIAGSVNLIDNDAHGPAWGDYDNDGDPDLYQSMGNLQPNPFYRNDAGLAFPNVATQAGVDHSGSGRGAAWADYDNDGDLDLMMTSIVKGGLKGELFQNQSDGTFAIKTDAAGLGTVGYYGVLWGDYNNDNLLDMLLFSEGNRKLMRNNGNGTFTDRSIVLDNLRKRVQGLEWVDYDNDGDLDLYASRGARRRGVFWDNNKIRWRNEAQSDGPGFDFRLSSAADSVTFNLNNMCREHKLNDIYIGVSGAHPSSIPFTLGNGQSPDPLGEPPSMSKGIFIWVDQDGLWHYRAKNWRSSGPITTNGSFSEVTPYLLDPFPTPDDYKNQLWENVGNETFVDVTDQANAGGGPGSSKASVWGDFDNDGDVDLYISNQGYFDFNESNVYLVNNGDKTFTEATASAGLTALVDGYGDVTATADYNRDGFLDIALSNGATGPAPCVGPLMLFENQGNNNHWLQIKTVGTVSNKDGIGTYITLTSGDLTQYRQQVRGQHGNAQDSSLVHFGLGSRTIVDTLVITWPSGIIETYNNLGVDQTITLVEDEPLSDPPDSSNKVFLPIVLKN